VVVAEATSVLEELEVEVGVVEDGPESNTETGNGVLATKLDHYQRT
jgi:hypothetical protein